MRYFITIILILAMTFTAKATSDEVFTKQYDALHLQQIQQELPDSARKNLNNLNIDKNMSFDKGINNLLDSGRNQLGGIFKRGLSCIVIIMSIAILCGVAASLYESAGSQTVPNVISAAGAIAVTTAAAGSVTSLFAMGKTAITDMSIFSKALMPALAAAATASGTPISGAARYAATMLFSDVLITITSSFLLPLIYVYVAASTADAAIGNGSITKVADFIKWIVKSTLKVLLTVYVGYITISGIISGTTDVIAARTAKFALNGAVPVVGSIISDAADTVLAGALLIKNAVGIFGMLAILAACLTPFLTIGINYLLFKGAAAVSAPICDSKISKLVDNIADSFGIVLGMTGSCALMIFISIISSMYAAGTL